MDCVYYIYGTYTLNAHLSFASGVLASMRSSARTYSFKQYFVVQWIIIDYGSNSRHFEQRLKNSKFAKDIICSKRPLFIYIHAKYSPRLEVEDPVPVQVEGLEDVLYEVLPPHARRKQRRELTENSRLINTK